MSKNHDEDLSACDAQTETIRCFFAIPLTDEMKNHMQGYIDAVKDYFSFNKVGWTRVDNLHITLWFLGNISPGVLEKVMDDAGKAIESLPPFQFSFGESGAFPNFKKPKIILLGVYEGKHDILALRYVLDGVLKNFPIQRDRENYAPHITLGRVRSLSANYSGEGVDGSVLPRWSDKGACAQDVNEVYLFKSELHPAGPIYTVLKTFQLKGETGSSSELLKLIAEREKNIIKRKLKTNNHTHKRSRQRKTQHVARRRF